MKPCVADKNVQHSWLFRPWPLHRQYFSVWPTWHLVSSYSLLFRKNPYKYFKYGHAGVSYRPVSTPTPQTNSMEHSPWEANSYSVVNKFPVFYAIWNSLLPHSKEPLVSILSQLHVVINISFHFNIILAYTSVCPNVFWLAFLRWILG